MTIVSASAIMDNANPILTVAPLKEETEMLGATNKITALYCRLSQEDERSGESLSIRPVRKPSKKMLKIKDATNKRSAQSELFTLIAVA